MPDGSKNIVSLQEPDLLDKLIVNLYWCLNLSSAYVCEFCKIPESTTRTVHVPMLHSWILEYLELSNISSLM